MTQIYLNKGIFKLACQYWSTWWYYRYSSRYVPSRWREPNIDQDAWRHMVSKVSRRLRYNIECGCHVVVADATLMNGYIVYRCLDISVQWRHDGHDSVSNHQPYDCLLNRLFRRRSKKTSKLRVTGLCAGNSPGAGEFPARMASNAENVSIWWRHHDKGRDKRNAVYILLELIRLKLKQMRIFLRKPWLGPLFKALSCEKNAHCSVVPFTIMV